MLEERGDHFETKAAPQTASPRRTGLGCKGGKRAWAAAGQQAMTQEELNQALCDACGEDNDLPRAVEMLDRGADPNVLMMDGYNVLHWAAMDGDGPTPLDAQLEIVTMLLGRGAVLELRSSRGMSALLLAALCDYFELCLLLIARGADLRVVDKDNHSALSHYGIYASGYYGGQGLDPSVKALRVAELKKAWREGCHPSQVQRRKDENWAKRWPLMNVATGCGLLLTAAKMAQLKATALPTDAKLPDEPTATEEQRRALRHSKVLGNIGPVRRIASFIPDKERGEDDEDSLDGLGKLDSEGDSDSDGDGEGSGGDEDEEDEGEGI